MTKKFIQPNINSIMVSGRLTKDPELKYGSSGTAYVQTRIANNRAIKAGNEWRQETSFFSVVIWDKAAEKFASIAHKGDSVIVDGWLKQREWTDDDGNKHNSVEIIARKIHDIERQRATEEAPVENDHQDIERRGATEEASVEDDHQDTKSYDGIPF